MCGCGAAASCLSNDVYVIMYSTHASHPGCMGLCTRHACCGVPQAHCQVALICNAVGVARVRRAAQGRRRQLRCALGASGNSALVAGSRIPMAAMQPGRVPLYLLHGNVLRAPHPGQKYVEEDEDMVDVGLEFLQGDAAMAAMAVAKRKSGADGCHPTAPEALVVQCSSDALGEAGGELEQITQPSASPWEYRNVYRCAPCCVCCAQMRVPSSAWWRDDHGSHSAAAGRYEDAC